MDIRQETLIDESQRDLIDESQRDSIDENQGDLIDESLGALLSKTPVSKLIWKLSIPSVIGILSYNLYHIINTIYISRGLGAYAAGGLAITLPISIFLSALSNKRLRYKISIKEFVLL